MSSTLDWLENGSEDQPIKKDVVAVETTLPESPVGLSGSDVVEHLEDITSAISQKERTTATTIVVRKRRPQAGTLQYGVQSGLTSRSNVYRGPFHDYAEIARAVDTESFLARSIQKHREYILKESFELIGTSPETVKYIRSRLFHIELATGLTTREWLREVVTNLVTYSTSFVVLKRDNDRSEGSPIRLHRKRLDPIAGIFPMDTVSVKVKQNQNGKPIEWKQELEGKTRKFNADDVINITIDKKSGFVFGTPYSVTVLDDIRALRRLEELIEMVAHKHLFPLFHVKVGTDANPAQDIETPEGALSSEVELARVQIQDMPVDGGLVTSERFALELIGSNDKVLDLIPYIEHFKARVMMGLRLSPLDLGAADTGNKATAAVVNRNLVDAVKDFQSVVADALTSKLFDILLLEGGFDLTEETRVKFRFPSADREEERTHQQHGLTLYQSNSLTTEEYRTEYLRKNTLTDEQMTDTWHELYEKPIEEMKMEVQIQAAKMQAQARPTSSSSSSSSSSSKKKDGSQVKSNTIKARPRNQFVLSGSKPTFPANDISDLLMMEWSDTKMCVVNGRKDVESAIKSFGHRAISIISVEARRQFQKGLLGTSDSDDDNIMTTSDSPNLFTDKTIKDNLQKILERTIIMLSGSNTDRSRAMALFDSIGVELKVKAERMSKAAFLLGAGTTKSS